MCLTVLMSSLAPGIVKHERLSYILSLPYAKVKSRLLTDPESRDRQEWNKIATPLFKPCSI